MQDQICEQRLEAVRVDGCDQLPSDVGTQVAEQTDPHKCRFC